MSGPPGGLSPMYAERQLRAEKLAQRPAAKEIMAFYMSLLKLQEPVYRMTLSSDWLAAVRGDGSDKPPYLRLDHLPVEDLVPDFGLFLKASASLVTETLAPVARSIIQGGAKVQAELITAFRGQQLTSLAETLGTDPVQLEFFPRAYMQPVTEALAERNIRQAKDEQQTSCPQCGHLPLVGMIRDEAEVKGRRLLVCSLCATEWSFRRLTCPNCEENDPAKLSYHESETLPHLRIEECQSCGVYMKSVDLRQLGTAVPLVEDIASVELDIWAQEQGLQKIERNVLGL
ncbi:MAG: formate dehydrogenase accessory protein FdhE [Gemmatimonadales bacterium]